MKTSSELPKDESASDQMSSKIVNKDIKSSLKKMSVNSNELNVKQMNGIHHKQSGDMSGIEKNYLKSKQLNGLALNDRKGSSFSDNISLNHISNNVDHCMKSCCSHSITTSSSIPSNSCCSSHPFSCDINNQSHVHPFNDKDLNCLTEKLENDLLINENSFDINNINEKDIEISKRIVYVNYESEAQMPDIMRLIQKDLSEPYSIYTYRYFIHNWPHLCFLAMDNDSCVGAIVCKLDLHKKMIKRGYIAMLAVDENYRKMKIGSNLVLRAIQAMVAGDADEVVLETEVTNKPALQLYENLGFVRDKRLFRYYLNGVDALRLKLWLK